MNARKAKIKIPVILDPAEADEYIRALEARRAALKPKVPDRPARAAVLRELRQECRRQGWKLAEIMEYHRRVVAGEIPNPDPIEGDQIGLDGLEVAQGDAEAEADAEGDAQ